MVLLSLVLSLILIAADIRGSKDTFLHLNVLIDPVRNNCRWRTPKMSYVIPRIASTIRVISAVLRISIL